jgi:hypothetical protein
MMRIPVLGALFLAGCAPVSSPVPQEDRLAQELAGRVAGTQERCVLSETDQPITVANARTLLYRRGGTIWVNRQDRDCFGSDPLATLVVEPFGSSYCSGDRVRRLERGSSVPGPTCLLQDWVPYRRPS